MNSVHFLTACLHFQVTASDQAVIEGQEVTMSVRISGQPKPMLYWYVISFQKHIKQIEETLTREIEETLTA